MFKCKVLARLSVLFLYTMTMLMAGISKIGGGGTPDWFIKQFGETILNVFPGSLHIQFFTIAGVETIIGMIALLGIVTLQKKEISLRLMNISLLGASFLFAGLSLGQRITYKFQDSAMLFFYSIASIIVLIILNKESEV